jgi:hypothetical protein
MDKLHNDQTKKDKMAYNDLENITQKTKDRVEHHLNLGVNACAPER